MGGFGVTVDGREVAAEEWPTRRAAELVQLLALADGRRLPRERVIDALWPMLAPEAGAANLRKAAHHARRTLGGADVRRAAWRDGRAVPGAGGGDGRRGVRARSPRCTCRLGCGEAARGQLTPIGGELLPEALYEEWTQAPRRASARVATSSCCAALGNGSWWWRLDPTDEPACRELMRRELERGSRPAAIRWFGRLRSALRRELGVPPSAETLELFERCIAGLERA